MTNNLTNRCYALINQIIDLKKIKKKDRCEVSGKWVIDIVQLIKDQQDEISTLRIENEQLDKSLKNLDKRENL